jgi:hypothetical protein
VSPEDIVHAAYAAFEQDARSTPPLTLRGGGAVDDYDSPDPFDPVLDDPSDEYLERFAFHGLVYLDARSWRHYLPRLIDYALRRPDDPAMAAEALVRTLRPPDRYPPRLGTLTPAQEDVVRAFLERVALGGRHQALSDEASQALDEWWLPGARHRPTDDELAALRSAPVVYRHVERPSYRLTLPTSLATSGARDLPEEKRTVEVWSGVLGGDAHTVVAVNVTPADDRPLDAVLERAAGGLRAARVDPRPVDVPGSTAARRLDGWTRGDSPAEPQRLTLVAAATEGQVVLLTIRGWPREDVDAATEKIASSLAVRVT